MAKQDWLIRQLNPLIRGWANYYQHVVSQRIFDKVSCAIWRCLSMSGKLSRAFANWWTDTSMIAAVTAGKHGDGTPLYRMEDVDGARPLYTVGSTPQPGVLSRPQSRR